MRLFVAVQVPEHLKKGIVEAQERVRKAGIDAKIVEAENLHFTIKFLGETEKADEIKSALERACAGFPVFDIGIRGISAFPSMNYARVVWLSVKEGLEQFKLLCGAVDEELSRIGFEKEKDYVPHLTLARVRSGGNRAELLKILENLGKTEIGSMRVGEVKLMKSTLRRSGPVYEEIYSVKLE